MVIDVNRNSPCDNTHCNKLTTMPTGWNIMGQVEVMMMIGTLYPMVEVEDGVSKTIYR